MAQLGRIEGIGRQVAEAVFRSRAQTDLVEREIERAGQCGLRILSLEDAAYPKPLLNIPDPPTCLYVRGNLEPADSVAVAIVGTRRCSHYGREQAVRFAELLARAGFTIVSGLARGIDSLAHRGALRGGGRTIAVLGNGLSSVYPPEHEALAAEVAQSGAVVSELPVDTGPEAKNFPGRNRIITGLSLGVIIIEAGKRSGALISARLASEYNREVFALPGNVDRPEVTAGTNGLIRDGSAKLVTCLEDVLDELADVGEIMRPERAAPGASSPTQLSQGDSPETRVPNGLERLSDDQRAVFDAVVRESGNLDAIVETTRLDASCVMSALTTLELTGLIKRLPGNRFVPRTAATAP